MNSNHLHEWAPAFAEIALHFLWQGTAIALIAGLLASITQRHSARLTHSIYLLALGLMAACIPFTWFTLTPEKNVVTNAAPPALAATPSVESGAPPEPNAAPTISGGTLPNNVAQAQQAEPLIQRAAPFALAAYALGLAFMLFRLAMAVCGGRHLQRTARPIRDKSVLAAMSRLCGEMRIHAQPTIAFHDRVLTPVVVGIFKPMILFPAAAVTHLTPSQLETVMAHELAHIRRFDHLALLLQRLIEAALFFHPAVWWLSRKIDHSRELCCDDLVLNAGAEAADYAESLIIFSELKHSGMTDTHTMQLAATGEKSNDLRQRILRILGHPEPSWFRLSRGGMWATVIMIAAGLSLPAMTVKGDSEDQDANEDKTIAQPEEKQKEKKRKKTHRLLFVPDAPTGKRTSWTSFGRRLHDMERLSLSATVTLDGEFPLTAPDAHQEWARGRMLKGDDDMITMRFFNYVGEEAVVHLKRDETQTVRIGKRDFRVRYPSVYIAIESPNIVNGAHLFITHEPEESVGDRFITEMGVYKFAEGTREVSLSINGETLRAQVKFIRESGHTATSLEFPLTQGKSNWFAYTERDRIWIHNGSDRFTLVSATPTGTGTFAVDKELGREVPLVVRTRIKKNAR